AGPAASAGIIARGEELGAYRSGRSRCAARHDAARRLDLGMLDEWFQIVQVLRRLLEIVKGDVLLDRIHLQLRLRCSGSVLRQGFLVGAKQSCQALGHFRLELRVRGDFRLARLLGGSAARGSSIAWSSAG